MNDYHAFNSTKGGGGAGGSSGCLPWIIGGLVVLYLLGKLFA